MKVKESLIFIILGTICGIISAKVFSSYNIITQFIFTIIITLIVIGIGKLILFMKK